jgi:hypothetical protein
MEPRIYLYKVTFEETPDWYWGVHKEKKYGEAYLGSPKTHAWKWEFYTPILEICEFFPYTDGGWVDAQNVENRCIKPDLNNPLCLNEHYGSVISSEACKRGGTQRAEKLHEEKDEFGRSVQGVKFAERMHKEKDEFGRSVHTLKLHEEKDELGRSVLGVENGRRLNKEKDDSGKSVNAIKPHKQKDGLGRSIHALKTLRKAHEEKDNLGRSVIAVKGAATTLSQKWKDPQHPELGEHNPGTLALMQKSRGYPHGKENRVRV